VRRALLTLSTVAVAAVLVPPALAHVVVRPAGIESGTTAALTLETPSEREGSSTTRLVLTVPDDVEIIAVRAPAGWSATHDAVRATWAGGRIAEGTTEDFPVEIAAGGPARTVTLDVVQGYDDGAEVSSTPSLVVLPSDAAAPSQHLGRALVASAVGLGVVALSLVVLRRARRRPPRDA
jgi:uncharacterized protein YcnI